MLRIDFRLDVKGFSLEACFEADKEILALFGYSGSGKSLTLETIAGLRRPSRGFIALDGSVVFDSQSGLDVPAHERGIAYLVQDGALFPHLSVEENISYGLHRMGRSERSRRIAELLELLDLQDLKARFPRSLSGGQKQRVALARALAPRPKTLLLDEPFGALDSTTRETLRRELNALQSELGLTIVFVTHDLSEAYSFGGKMAVYDGGRILQIGPSREIYAQPNSRRVALLTGTANVIPGIVESSTADGLVVRTANFTVQANPYAFGAGDRIQLCVRPESILMLRKDRRPSAQSRENNVTGTIVDETARGSLHTLYFRPDAGGEPGDATVLQIELPAHVYKVMNVAETKVWTVSLRRDALHAIAAEDAAIART